MRVRVVPFALLALLVSAEGAFGQNLSWDARDVALGGVGGTGNLATKMIEEQRGYTSIVLPLGFFQIFSDMKIYDPNSAEFDPVRAIANAASPYHFIIGRGTKNSGEALFVSDIRNATLSRDLSRYKGFVPANDLLAEGLLDPSVGGTVKVRKDARGGFQGIFVGAGPYLSVHASGTIDSGLTNVLATGVNVRNATFPISNADEGQVALAITGGYRGRFAWPAGVGTGSDREGLYVAANYNFLHGFQYEHDGVNVSLNTDNAGLLGDASNIKVNNQHATKGTGFALDLGVGAVINRIEFGFGAKGIANRIDWSGLEQTTYTLASVTSGNSDFTHTTTVAAADTRVELPVDYRGNVRYHTAVWSAAVEVGHGFGGGSFHAGLERRISRIELRGGARYTFSKWNPSGGVGFDLTPRVSLDVAAFGTNTNIERKRQMAIAASIRFNHLNK